MRNDIQINGNIIGGRQGWAYICNSMRFAVLKADMEKEQEFGADGYSTFGDVRVIWNYKGEESTARGILECENGEWKIGGWGCCIHSQFGFSDMMESINEANNPVIRKDDIVAIALFSQKSKFAVLNLFKVGKIDINCQTITRLTPLTDEEMQEIKKDADKWCNR